MTQLQNFHKLFRNDEKGYWTRLRPSDVQVKSFSDAQKQVRDHLVKDLANHYGVTPKFRVQGSWAYATCNQPAQLGQEMDLDYGVYLPAKVFSAQRSAAEAKQYFEITRASLQALCDAQKWELDSSPDAKCLRFRGFMPSAHMDIPLYAVPDDMFDDLEENHRMLLEKSLKTNDPYAMDALTAQLYDNVFRAEARSIDLSKIEMIHMAKPDGEWKASDCEKVKKWFQDECMKHPNGGLQLRSMARYLKGWRDQTWKTGGPTSILLMIIAVQCYRYVAARDDHALLSIVKDLPTKLNEDIFEPNIDGHKDENFNKSTPQQRAENVLKAKELLSRLTSATQSKTAQLTIDFLVADFGRRIPNDTSLVIAEPAPQNPYVEIKKNIAPQRASAPAVIAPQSGG